jgi:hypothetical protein
MNCADIEPTFLIVRAVSKDKCAPFYRTNRQLSRNASKLQIDVFFAEPLGTQVGKFCPAELIFIISARGFGFTEPIGRDSATCCNVPSSSLTNFAQTCLGTEWAILTGFVLAHSPQGCQTGKSYLRSYHLPELSREFWLY